jgi:mannose-1-phosphate guanylyltransferase
MLHSVIMAGGLGTRFWPLSRRDLPKQFLSLTGECSLIQAAFDIVDPWVPADRVWVITNARYADRTREHLPRISREHILLEPCGRNTAPCIGLAAMCLETVDPEAVMLVMPADHVIAPAERFQADVERAVQMLNTDPQRLVLFGVPPSSPATGFGYIERGTAVAPGIFAVTAFKEKPNLEVAEGYCRAGTFFWNCGIFVWRAARILELLRQFEPEIAALLDELRPYLGTPDWNNALARIFPQMKSISIDYAILEREKNVAVLEAAFQWDDVGSWEAMARMVAPDAQGNIVTGQYAGIDNSGCIIRSSGNHLIATLGMQDCIVVHTPDATLVADRKDENAIRKLIALLEERGLEGYL